MEAISLSKRVGSMVLDYVIVCAIFGVFGILIHVIEFPLTRSFKIDLNWVRGILLLAIVLNKDYFRGKSMAKRAFGLVVLKNTGEPATRLQCLIRNITFVIFPVEGLISLFSRQRRLGDLIAGTRVEPADTELVSTIVDDFKREFQKTPKG